MFLPYEHLQKIESLIKIDEVITSDLLSTDTLPNVDQIGLLNSLINLEQCEHLCLSQRLDTNGSFPPQGVK